jgi:hypothetical protein
MKVQLEAVFSMGSAPRLYHAIDSSKQFKQAEVIQNHENANVSNIGQGEPRHRKYKRLKLGGGQTYDRSSDWTAIVAGATSNRTFSAVLNPN